jgi:hypothetical protein
MCFNPISFFYKISILSIIVDRKSNDALIEPFFSSSQRGQYTWFMYKQQPNCLIGNEH